MVQAVITQAKAKEAGIALSGILLVSGTCIGAGILALPVVTGVAGFYPAMAINLLCWLVMMGTGLLFLEATLWMQEGANVLTMARRFLGPAGKTIGGLSFLFLYYCLQVSYIAGGTPLLSGLVEQFSGYAIEGLAGYFIFSTLFGLILFLGTRAVDRVNWILMFGLVFSYVLLIGAGSGEVQLKLLARQDWGLFLLAAPTLFSAYGFHNVIPSITTYLNRNVAKLRISIILGTAIPFAAYSIWQWLIIGTISAEGIKQAELSGVPISQALQNISGHPWISALGAYFGFFALATSFLGVSLSMMDFLADGLNLKNAGLMRFSLCMGIFLPPAFIAGMNPGIFLQAIGIAGGFGEAILNGLFPVAMVWIGRYSMGLKSEYALPGGRAMLAALLAFTLLIMGVEAYHLLS